MQPKFVVCCQFDKLFYVNRDDLAVLTVERVFKKENKSLLKDIAITARYIVSKFNSTDTFFVL